MNSTEKNTIFIKNKAVELGFDHCGIVRAEPLDEDARRLEKWLNKGMHGTMQYMENHFDMRIDPAKLVPGARSVITLLMNYFPAAQQLEQAPKIRRRARREWPRRESAPRSPSRSPRRIALGALRHEQVIRKISPPLSGKTVFPAYATGISQNASARSCGIPERLRIRCQRQPRSTIASPYAASEATSHAAARRARRQLRRLLAGRPPDDGGERDEETTIQASFLR